MRYSISRGGRTDIDRHPFPADYVSGMTERQYSDEQVAAIAARQDIC